MIKSHHHNRLLKEKVYRRKGNKKVTLPRDPPISVITFLSYVLSCFSHVQLLAIPWTIACQVPLSMGFSWQGYWSGLPFLPAGDGMKHQHCRVVWNFLLLTPCFLPLLYFISFVQQSTESCLQALPNLPYTLFPTRWLSHHFWNSLYMTQSSIFPLHRKAKKWPCLQAAWCDSWRRPVVDYPEEKERSSYVINEKRFWKVCNRKI